MNASERKALAFIQERAASGPWATTHAEAASACGLSLSAWKRALPALRFAGLVTVASSRGHGLTLSIGPPQSSPEDPAKVASVMTQPLASVARLAKLTSQRSQSSPKTGPCLARSFETTSLLVVGSKEETTNDEQTTVVEQTARDTQGSQSSPAKAAKFTPQSSPTDLCGRALDYAERCGRLEAENAYLRERLARLETPCCLEPAPTSTASVPVAGTPMTATETPATLTRPAGVSGTPTPTATPMAPTGPRPGHAAPSPPSAAPLHPANRRDDPLPPAPSPDDAEDQRLFLELAREQGLSEQAAEASLMDAWRAKRPLHEAIASVWLIREGGGEQLRDPWVYLWAMLNRTNKAKPPEGACARWDEIKTTWLDTHRKRNKKTAARAAKAEAGVSVKAADYPMNLDRPLVRVLSEKAKAEGW